MDTVFSWCLIQDRRAWESAFPLRIYKYKSFFGKLLYRKAVNGSPLPHVNVNRFLGFADEERACLDACSLRSQTYKHKPIL